MPTKKRPSREVVALMCQSEGLANSRGTGSFWPVKRGIPDRTSFHSRRHNPTLSFCIPTGMLDENPLHTRERNRKPRRLPCTTSIFPVLRLKSIRHTSIASSVVIHRQQQHFQNSAIMSTRKVANDDERTQSTAGSAVNTAKTPLSTFGDQISSRLDDEIVKMKPTNRTSDLVPLNHRYVFMQKELRGLIEASKTYHRKMVEMDQARMEVSMANVCSLLF